MKRIFLAALLMALLCGCASEAPVPETVPTTEAVPETMAIEEIVVEEAPPAMFSVVLQPEATGIRETRTDDAVVDHSNTSDGYVMACFTGFTEARLKVRIQGPKTLYTYNLTPEEWTVFPLSDGDGCFDRASQPVHETLHWPTHSKCHHCS